MSLRARRFLNSDDGEYWNRFIHPIYLFKFLFDVAEHLDRCILIRFIRGTRHGRLREQRPTSSMAKTLVFAISMSEPTSGLINRVPVWFRNNLPRRLTLIWPKASCTTTCCPIHHSNAFCIRPRPCTADRQHGRQPVRQILSKVIVGVALLPWPVPDPFHLLGPLHDSREKAITRTEKRRSSCNGHCDPRLMLQQLVEVSV
jgi:hypothetical protein